MWTVHCLEIANDAHLSALYVLYVPPSCSATTCLPTGHRPSYVVWTSLSLPMSVSVSAFMPISVSMSVSMSMSVSGLRS